MANKLNSETIRAIEKILEKDKTAIIKPTKDKILIQEQQIKTEYSQPNVLDCKSESAK